MRRADESTTTGSGSLLTRCRPATACVRRFVHQSQMPLNEYKILSSKQQQRQSCTVVRRFFFSTFFPFRFVTLWCTRESVCVYGQNANGSSSTEWKWLLLPRRNKTKRKIERSNKEWIGDDESWVQNRIHLERDRCTIPKNDRAGRTTEDLYAKFINS